MQLHALSTEVSALNDLAIADIQTALTNQGYTSARAPNLDNLDAAISTRSSHTAAGAADAVWDELLAGHAIVGSAGEALTDAAAGGSLTAADIADAVWDEAIAGHVAGGSFGEEVQAPATSAEITALNDPTAAAIADAVWDEAIADHLIAGSTGEGISNASGSSATPAQIADAVWDELTSGHSVSGSFGLLTVTNLDANVSSRATQVSVDALETAADIADAVWDEVAGAHTTAGTFGDYVDTPLSNLATSVEIAALPMEADIADAVWDEATAGHVTSGTFGEYLGTVTPTRGALLDNLDVAVSTRSDFDETTDDVTVAAASEASIVDAVWDEATASHVISGSTGEAVAAAGTPASAIADAVWDEAAAGHVTAGTFGKLAADTLEDTATTLPATLSTLATAASITALENLSSADVQAALTAQGYTVGRAALIDNADVAVSTRSDFDATTDEILTKATERADIADLVWDEAKAAHVGVGSFGEEVQAHATSSEIAALTDLSIADVQTALTNQGYTAARATNLDDLDVAVSSRSDFDVTVDIVIHDGDALADDVWNEDTLTHAVAGTFGDLIADNLDATVSSRATAASIAALNDLSSADVQTALTAQGYTSARAPNLDNLDVAVSTRSDFNEATDDVTLAAASATSLVDDVWDELIAGHLGVGSVGEALDNAVAPTAGAVADAVWDEATAGHVTASTFGKFLADQLDATVASRSTFNPATQEVDVGSVTGTPVTDVTDFQADTSLLATSASIAALNDPTAGAIADAVWDEAIAAHAAVGSTGEALADAAAALGLTAAAVADAVWDEAQAGHVTAGTFGLALDATISSRATAASIAALNDLSTADVQTALDAQGYTVTRAGKLDNLDATVSSRSTFDDTTDPVLLAAAAVDAVWDEAIAGHLGAGTTGKELADKADSVEIAALNDLSSADVQTALTAQGYTSARATLIDNLDAAISSVSTFNPATTDVTLSAAALAAAADAVWDEAASGHVTAGSFGEEVQTARKHLSNRAVITGSGPYTVTVYEDDGTTVLQTFTVSTDKLVRTPL